MQNKYVLFAHPKLKTFGEAAIYNRKMRKLDVPYIGLCSVVLKHIYSLKTFENDDRFHGIFIQEPENEDSLNGI